MHHLFMRSLCIVACILAGGLVGHAADAAGWVCSAKPVAPCVKQRGRLSSQNGISLKVWLIGTKRVLAVSFTEVPAFLERYLLMTSDDHSHIFGDFEVCPLGPDVPGEARSACIIGGERLVVQNLRRERPPFRLLSTWPKDAR